MNNDKQKKHWETVYETTRPSEVSWTQEIPRISLDLIASFGVDKQAKIIDVGGGDSKLVDHLLEQGYKNITVLDISEKALEKAKERLGVKAGNVSWIVSDIMDFKPKTTYDIWHDRATFHFLTMREQVSMYVSIAQRSVTKFLTIGTFSEYGPQKCSGLPIKQYSETTLSNSFVGSFEKIRCTTENHTTPFQTIQQFLFCSFKRKI
ncbi:class I SAM-dependent methyltransferase [Niabella beijingensis]|uniref:class I SAM-dependent methyltransferase n=1 Tax=Niabella beijingensis TaxID=2872700 RepID=UPI001CC12A9B|nr:class I SAM-dependent methyltransferase [Niabella beijingensis]MBZ4191651.1 class I SAM-dependent methyltransferase [Niabella beijingensis]